MNKQQKEYLLAKARDLVRKKKREFEKDKPTEHSTADKIAKLKKAGFVENDNLEYYAARLKLPLTAEHKKNAAAIAAFNAKLDAAISALEDEVNLGDSKDALSILEKFTASLEGIK